jgi:hypothetical protein
MIFSSRYRGFGHDPAGCDRDRALLAAIRVAPLASLIRALRVWRGDRDWRRVAVLRQIRRLGRDALKSKVEELATKLAYRAAAEIVDNCFPTSDASE